MAYAEYHINPYFNYRNSRFFVTVAAVGLLVKKLIHLKISKTGIVARINRDLRDYNNRLQFYKQEIEGINSAEAKVEYRRIAKLLNDYRKFYFVLEKYNFFRYNQTELISEEVLTNLYSIEAVIKHKAFINVSKNPEDKELTEFASRISMSSIS